MVTQCRSLHVDPSLCRHAQWPTVHVPITALFFYGGCDKKTKTILFIGIKYQKNTFPL